MENTAGRPDRQLDAQLGFTGNVARCLNNMNTTIAVTNNASVWASAKLSSEKDNQSVQIKTPQVTTINNLSSEDSRLSKR